MKKLLQHVWRAIADNKQDPVSPAKANAGEAAVLEDASALEAAFDNALRVHQAGRTKDAQAAYLKILQSAPNHAPALHFLGVSYGQDGNFPEAERLIRESIRIQELPDYYSNLARVLVFRGRRDDAAHAYQKILTLDPDNAEARLSLGDLYSGDKRYTEAEQAYRSALVLRPDDADAAFKMGAVLAELGRAPDAIAAYRRALSLRPSYSEASNNLAILLKNSGQIADAEAAYRQALLLQPDVAAIHCNLGQLLQDAGRYADAESFYQRALELQPEFAGAHNSLANLYVATGRQAEAETSYRRALALQPDYAEAHNNLGNLLKDMGNPAAGEAEYRRALDSRHDYAEAWSNLGVLLEGCGRLDEAEAAHLQALSLTVDWAPAHNGLANIYRKTDRIGDAERAYRKAVHAKPDFAQAWANLGALLQAGGRLKEAEEAYLTAIEKAPNSHVIHNNYGLYLQRIRRYPDAESAYGRSLALQPEYAEACNNLGNLFREMDRNVEAEAAYRRAITLQPNLVIAHNNLGVLLQRVERYAEAENAYRRALEIDPGFRGASFNLALLCLSRKQFAEGWDGYELRWFIEGFNSEQRKFPLPQWQGEPLAGRTLLVWQEQGIGDVILYLGLIPELIAAGASIVLECEPRLMPLLSRSFSRATVVARSNPPHTMTLSADWQISLGSLPRWLRRNADDYVWKGRYLEPDAGRVSTLRHRYRSLGDGPVVGISWRSSNDKMGQNKSIALREWARLLPQSGVTFVNLQYGDCVEELAQVRREWGVSVYQDQSVDPLKDLDGFAAQVAAMDLVISTSNTTVHFAGALDVPVWTLLPRGGFELLWYWFTEGEESLWYPRMRLFRQDAPGSWNEPVARTAEALRQFLTDFQRQAEPR